MLRISYANLRRVSLRAYKDKHGVPKMDVIPNQDDFELEEVTDDEEDNDEDVFDLKYKELTEESEEEQD